MARPDSTPADEACLARVLFGRRVHGGSMSTPQETIRQWGVEARRLCESALAKDGTLAAAHYVLGVMANEYWFDDLPPGQAVDHLRRATELAPEDVGARYHLALALDLAGEREQAVPHYERVIALGPEFVGPFLRPALYRCGRILQRGRTPDEQARGKAYLDRHGALPPPASTDQEKWDVALGLLGRVRMPGRPPAAQPAPAAAARASFEPALVLLGEAGAVRSFDVADVDGDHRDDVVAAGEEGLWVALQRGRGFLERRIAEGRFEYVLCAELENEGHASVLAWGLGGTRLLTPCGGGAFADDSQHLPAPQRVAGFVPVDFDHEGNLDLLALAGGSFRLLRSRGVPRSQDERAEKFGPIAFDDVTAGGALEGAAGTWAEIEDLDGDHDVDLLLGGEESPTLLLSNLRRGRFEALGSGRTGLPDDLASKPAVADFDHDSVPDVLVPGARPRLLRGRGDLGFDEAPMRDRLARATTAGANLADLDLDGEWEWVEGDVVTDVDLDGRLDSLSCAARRSSSAYPASRRRWCASPGPTASCSTRCRA